MKGRDDARVPPAGERRANPAFMALLVGVSQGCSVFVVLVGLVVLVGWGLQLEPLKRGFRAHVATNPVTALTLIVVAGALWVQHRAWKGSSASPRASLSVRTAAAVSVAVGVMTLAGYVVGRNLGLDEIVFRGRLGVNRIAPNTGLSFVLVGVALCSSTETHDREGPPPRSWRSCRSESPVSPSWDTCMA